MDLKKQNIIKLQGKFSKRVKKYSEGLTIPEHKALKDITKGVISSSSVIVRQIATNLHETISLDKISGRTFISIP